MAKITSIHAAFVILGAAGAAGLVAMRFASEAGLGEPLSWIVLVLAAVAAGLLAAFIFDWALIAFSAAIGASLVTSPLVVGAGIRAVAWIILVIAGFAVQSRFGQWAGRSGRPAG